MSRSIAVAGISFIAVVIGACGGPTLPANNAGPTIGRPSADVVSTYAEPLIVDWDSDHRTDLEVLTRDRIAVVRYQKDAIMMLKDCTLEGSYGYVGVTKKEDLIRYESLDEVAANLPGIFAIGGASLGADMSKGTTIDIGLVVVGKRTAVRTSAERAELKGECEGATHFVRGATIGAFAVQTGQRSKVGTVASLFGAGVSASSGSSKLVSKKDGTIDKCSSSSTEAPNAPEGCRSLLRLELRPFNAPKVAAKDAAGKSVAKAKDIPECSAGFVWDGAKCATKSTTKAFACSGKDQGQCRAQCDKNNARSCSQLALIYRAEGKDQVQAVAFFKKACNLGEESACAEHGAHLLNGIGVEPDKFKALETFKKACAAGDSLGCSFLGRMHRAGTATEPSEAKALALFKRACDGGFSQGCVELGTVHEQGVGTRRDYKQALRYYERACKADDADGCAHLGTLYTSDRRGAGLDRQKAMELFKGSCDRNSALGCTELGNMYVGGAGMDRQKQTEHDQEAAKLYEKACGLWGGAEGCARLGYMMVLGWGVKRDTYAGNLKIKKGCEENSGYACVQLGKILAGGMYGQPRDAVKAYENYDKACNLFEGEGCFLIGQLYRNGEGVQRDDTRAHSYFERGCRTGNPRACYHVAADLYTGKGVSKRDNAKAMSHYEHSCAGGWADSCNEVGFLYDKGEGGVKQDKQKAAALFDQGCELGSSTACENLGRYIESGVYKASSKDRALELYAKACEADASKCSRLANKYEYGAGFPKDIMKALQYYRKACDKFHYPACVDLGRIYRSGYSGLNRDDRTAFGFYQKACSGRIESACDEMADMYAEGQGVSPDPVQAARLRQTSCDRGNTKSCRSLAKMYVDGVGVPKKDPEMAAKLHEKACYMRSRDDCYELALLYEKGTGVKQDGKKVAEFFQRSCNFGNYQACSNMGYFMYKGTADQKKDTAMGLSKLRYACSSYGRYMKDDKERAQKVWACGALKKLNQKFDPPAPKPTGPIRGTQKM
ncbi:MAG: sel1 repeat family protein [Myxococcales bacterium]|nr:sel1 repeat family protein [Myxococcales bacterium]